MQNQKVTFLLVSTDYEYVQVALVQEGGITHQVAEHKFTASKNLIVRILRLLEQAQLTWADLNFLATNQGPGPFTTLRTMITTLNGLAFSLAIPLIGVDGLLTFLHQFNPDQTPCIVMNAFGNDVYYAYYHNQTLQNGWMNINRLLSALKATDSKKTFTFAGNGAFLFKDIITQQLPSALFDAEQHPSLQALVETALKKWSRNETEQMLLPLYLKTTVYKMSS